MCRCGNRGCLETVARTDVLELGRAARRRRPEIAGHRARAEGDLGRPARAHRRRPRDRRVVGDLCNLLNPGAVIVGGELGAAGDLRWRRSASRSTATPPAAASDVRVGRRARRPRRGAGRARAGVGEPSGGTRAAAGGAGAMTPRRIPGNNPTRRRESMSHLSTAAGTAVLAALRSRVRRRRVWRRRQRQSAAAAPMSSGSSDAGEDRPAAPESKTTRYEARTGRCSSEARGAVPGLRAPLLERRPGRGQAAAGRGRDHEGGRGAGARPGRFRVGGEHRRPRQASTSRSSRTTGSSPTAGRDYYISFDNEQVGKLQGQASSRRSRRTARADRHDQRLPDRQQREAVQGGRALRARRARSKIGKEYDTPDWSPDKAQQEMEQAITALGKDKIDGVYAANDGTAGGAIAAMKPRASTRRRSRRPARTPSSRRSSGSSPASST